MVIQLKPTRVVRAFHTVALCGLLAFGLFLLMSKSFWSYTTPRIDKYVPNFRLRRPKVEGSLKATAPFHKKNILSHAIPPPSSSMDRTERTKVLKNLLMCKDRALQRQTLQYGEYWVIRNFVRGAVSKDVGCAEAITYTAAGDYTSFGMLATLVASWQAPVSLALYTPGHDFAWTMDALQYARNCLRESDLIRKYVSFHLYFPLEHLPSYVPRDEADVEKWVYSCRVKVAPYRHEDNSEIYRLQHKLGYPMNAGRNIARHMANTHYVLSADLELLPSVGLVDRFLDMLAREGVGLVLGQRPRVFVVPSFEVAPNETLPLQPVALAQLLRDELAQVLHLDRCPNCTWSSNYGAVLTEKAAERMRISRVVKAEDNVYAWEHYFISDKKAPIYDERLAWEGPTTKRFQGYAMCLLRYEYYLLHPAFLVGRYDSKLYDKDFLKPGVDEFMTFIINNELRPEYNVLYAYNPECII